LTGRSDPAEKPKERETTKECGMSRPREEHAGKSGEYRHRRDEQLQVPEITMHQKTARNEEAARASLEDEKEKNLTGALVRLCVKALFSISAREGAKNTYGGGKAGTFQLGRKGCGGKGLFIWREREIWGAGAPV